MCDLVHLPTEVSAEAAEVEDGISTAADTRGGASWALGRTAFRRLTANVSPPSSLSQRCGGVLALGARHPTPSARDLTAPCSGQDPVRESRETVMLAWRPSDGVGDFGPSSGCRT